MTFAPIKEFHLISDKIHALNVAFIILVNLLLILFIAYGAGVRKLSYIHLYKFGFFPLRVVVIYGLSLPSTAGGSLLDLMDSKHR